MENEQRERVRIAHSAMIGALDRSGHLQLFAFGVAIGQWFHQGTSGEELEKEINRLAQHWPLVAEEVRNALPSQNRAEAER